MKDNKKAGVQLTVQKLIILILAIGVLILAVMVISNQRIFDWIRGLPSYESPADNEKPLTPNEMRLLAYEKIGKVKLGKNTDTSFRQYYVIFLDRKLLEQKDCLSPNVWKTGVCFDSYGLIESEELCNKYQGTKGDACFDEAGNLQYTESYIESPIYWDWNIKDSYNGELKISNRGFDSELGIVKNNYFIIDWEEFGQNKDFLLKNKIDTDKIIQLNRAKYVGGDIYRLKDGVLKEGISSTNWPESAGIATINLDSSILNIDGKEIRIDIKKYITPNEKNCEYSVIEQNLELEGIQILCAYKDSGFEKFLNFITFSKKTFVSYALIRFDGYIWINKNAAKLNGVEMYEDYAFTKLGVNYYKTNLKLNYIEVEKKIIENAK
jgi:hypothetical protein